MKEALFHAEVIKNLRTCNIETRKKFGDLIFDLQMGKLIGPPESKSFSSIQKGVFELRVREDGNAYRIFYFTKVKDKILIFHMFQKKDNKTPVKEISTAKSRLKELLENIDEK